MRRGWIWLMAIIWVLGRAGLLALLFWGVHPLWLVAFWGLQGYPANLHDLQRWYAVGVFNAVPALAWLIWGVVLILVLSGFQARLSCRWVILLSALGGGLVVPPLAYILLLIYAGVWRYRAWDVVMPPLIRAYLMLAPSCMLVGACAGRWMVKRTQ